MEAKGFQRCGRRDSALPLDAHAAGAQLLHALECPPIPIPPFKQYIENCANVFFLSDVGTQDGSERTKGQTEHMGQHRLLHSLKPMKCVLAEILDSLISGFVTLFTM